MECQHLKRYAPRGLAGMLITMALGLTHIYPSVVAVPAAVDTVSTSLKVRVGLI